MSIDIKSIKKRIAKKPKMDYTIYDISAHSDKELENIYNFFKKNIR